MNDGAFDLLDAGFVDKTVTFLEGTGPSGEPTSLIVERGPVPKGETLASLVKGHVDGANRRLVGYSVLAQQGIEVVGLEGIEVIARWRQDDAMVYSRQAHIVLGRTWMILAAESDVRDRAFTDEVLSRALATFRPRAID